MKKAKERAAAAPRPPRRPPSPHPVIELSAARGVRTIAALKAATVKKFRAWKHRQPPDPTYKPFSKAWKEHPYGERRWNEYQQLEPIVSSAKWKTPQRQLQPPYHRELAWSPAAKYQH
ncbi:hypothetical protein AAVH_22375 [Aphelenchoides avenae]|nr:hypothetical protein AAVH_22375 [Aphelenchus avenae]